MKSLQALLSAGFLFFCQVSAQAARLPIAVNDVKGSNVDPGAVAIISERLRSELINSGAFRVMERAEMESILKEQGFQQSGACDESSCLVQVGQLLGVKRVVTGSVGVLGSFWTISLRMLNVETGEIIFTVNEDFEGDIRDVVSLGVAQAAEKLVARSSAEIQQAAFDGKSGALLIESSENGASVEIDGNLVTGVTPLSLDDFPAGKHEVVVRKGPFSGRRTVTVDPNSLAAIRIPMIQDKGALNVASVPSEASVFLTRAGSKISAQDGPNELGKTPLQLDSIEPGEYVLVLRKKGYDDFLQKISVRPNETMMVSDTLVKACRFLLFSYGRSRLEAADFHWEESGIFDLEYQGLRWESSSTYGLELSPIRLHFPPQGKHSFMLGVSMTMSADKHELASTPGKRIDNILHDTTTLIPAATSLRINRLSLSTKMPFGYRFMLKPLAVEPYVSVDFRVFHLTRMTGLLLDNNDSWGFPNMRIAFPVGACVYLYAGRTALIFRVEYSSDLTMIKLSNQLDYDREAGKNINGGFDSEKISSLMFSLGATF